MPNELEPKPYKTCGDKLEDYLAEKRARDEEKRETELLARAAQVRTLQGMLGPVNAVNCPHCGKRILDPRPTSPDDDYDTRA